MKLLHLIIFTLSGFLIFTSCNKSDVKIKTGSYSGTFSVTNKSGAKTGTTTLEIDNSNYSCSSQSNRIPAGGSGTFSYGNNKLKFNDENFWKADFDWGLILNGEYDYSFDGENLIISADRSLVLYEYDLKRN